MERQRVINTATGQYTRNVQPNINSQTICGMPNPMYGVSLENFVARALHRAEIEDRENVTPHSALTESYSVTYHWTDEQIVAKIAYRKRHAGARGLARRYGTEGASRIVGQRTGRKINFQG